MKHDLDIIIVAYNEEFLGKTIQDILSNIEGNTGIITVMDNYWAKDIPDDPRVTIIHNNVAIGQRGATNQAVKISNAKYIIKADAHCAFDKGFDVKMIEKMQDNWTMIPVMRNLHAFDWVCPEGHRRYQSPSGVCAICGKETHKDIVWIAKSNPQSTSYCFDTEPHFQYFKDWTRRPEYKKDLQEIELTETMSIQGSCFMLTRDKYWELNICDETFGSWGSQGIEVACKTWLSGGKVICNHNTWYAHLFRTQGGDFSFPYPQSGNQVQNAKKHAKEIFFDKRWGKYPMSWLIEKFSPVPSWTQEEINKLKSINN
jgi:glycosyltransferase involved in cell wall biosynthesis